MRALEREHLLRKRVLYMTEQDVHRVWLHRASMLAAVSFNLSAARWQRRHVAASIR